MPIRYIKNASNVWNFLQSTWYKFISFLLYFILENPKSKSNQVGTDKQLPPLPHPTVEQTGQNFDVVLDEEQGYYLMGNESEDSQTFVLSVSISGIKDLISVSIFLRFHTL